MLREFPGWWRFIPAWAGNTTCPLNEDSSSPVHPRVGGEHGSNGRPRGLAFGSSPRGRGTLLPPVTIILKLRFIPAWAGNTRGDRS